MTITTAMNTTIMMNMATMKNKCVLNARALLCAVILGAFSPAWYNNAMKTQNAELPAIGGAGHIVEIKEYGTVDFEYIARCITAEAGTQNEEARRLVADCIYNQSEALNRTPIETINAPHNFEVVSNGAIYRTESEACNVEIAMQEYTHRTNKKVMYFRTKHYHTFGKPYKSIQKLYFSEG